MGCRQSRNTQEQDPLPLINMLVVGLSGAGKTTLLNQLKGDPSNVCNQQLGINSFIVNKKIKIIAFEVAGRASKTWHSYYCTSNVVLFIVDSTQSSTFSKIQQILQEMDAELSKKSKIILVFNKVDQCMQNPNDPVDQQTSHVTQKLDSNHHHLKSLSNLKLDGFNHEIYTCKVSSTNRIGVTNLMKKIFSLCINEVFGEDSKLEADLMTEEQRKSGVK